MKVSYKQLSLRPYPGEVKVFRDLAMMRAYYESKTGKKYEYQDEATGGRYLRLEGKIELDTVWLVYARRPHVLAHELTHILLQVWNAIGAAAVSGALLLWLRSGGRWLAWVGLISYPLYLLHQDIGAIIIALLNLGTVGRFLVVLPILGAAAYIIHRFVENRYRHLLLRPFRSSPSPSQS